MRLITLPSPLAFFSHGNLAKLSLETELMLAVALHKVVTQSFDGSVNL
jgi:hypothetical protein